MPYVGPELPARSAGSHKHGVAAAAGAGRPPTPATDRPRDEPAFLPSRLAGNAGFVARSAGALAATCRRLVRDHPDPARLHHHQRLLAALNRQATELLTMSLVMARAADLGGPAEDLANTYCTAAQHRVTTLQRELTTLQPRPSRVAP